MANRAGNTVKLSISLAQSDYDRLKKRAKRVSDGNISGAVADIIRLAEEWEGREALAAWLGEGREDPSVETMNAIRAEWYGTERSSRPTSARRKKSA